MWGVQDTYGEANGTEWPIRTAAGISACNKNPKGADLYNNVLAKFMKVPSTATITALGKLAPGQVAEASPCPLTAGTTPANCDCTCSTGCVVDDVTVDGTAAKCKKSGAAQQKFTWTQVCNTVKSDTCGKTDIYSTTKPSSKAANLMSLVGGLLMIVYIMM